MEFILHCIKLLLLILDKEDINILVCVTGIFDARVLLPVIHPKRGSEKNRNWMSYNHTLLSEIISNSE